MIFLIAKYQTAGTWAVLTGGISGTAYNTIEASNTATGTQGCGIDVDNLPAGVSLQPVGVGAVVEITPTINCDTGDTEYVYQAMNNADGSCAI